MSYRLAAPIVSNADDFTEFKDSFVGTSTSLSALTCDGGSNWRRGVVVSGVRQ